MILVSIIVPCYNQDEFLAETLESVLSQTYSSWECIIINDGSIDTTEQVAKKYVSNDARFKYLYQDNQGVSAARNRGIACSCGEYILPLDGDDKISPNYLGEAVPILSSHSGVKIVYCNAEFFGETIGLWDIPNFNGIKDLMLNNLIFCSGMFRRLDYERTNGYDVKMINGLEDWEFWISLLKNGGTAYRIPSVHFFYRIRSGSRNSTINENKENFTSMKNQILKNHIELYLELLGNPIDLYIRNLELENTNKYLLNSKEFKIGIFFLSRLQKLRKILTFN